MIDGFLDVILNLTNSIFKPFSKNNSVPTYVNIDSNHPRSLLKQIPNAVNQRIKRLSLWGEQKYIWWNLQKKGFQGRLEYVNPVNPGSNGRSNSSGTRTLVKVGDTNNNNSNRHGKNRNRRVIWLNLPFCKLTNINIEKYSLKLLDKHFNRDNPWRKTFNRNTVKISYSYTKNIHSILNNHCGRLLDELNRNSGDQMWHLVTVEIKGYAPWTDDATQRISYTKHAFPPWNIIMIGRGSI